MNGNEESVYTASETTRLSIEDGGLSAGIKIWSGARFKMRTIDT